MTLARKLCGGRTKEEVRAELTRDCQRLFLPYWRKAGFPCSWAKEKKECRILVPWL